MMDFVCPCPRMCAVEHAVSDHSSDRWGVSVGLLYVKTACGGEFKLKRRNGKETLRTMSKGSTERAAKRFGFKKEQSDA